jgi:hypothetical protein
MPQMRRRMQFARDKDFAGAFDSDHVIVVETLCRR